MKSLLALHFLDVSNRFLWRIKGNPASITLAEQVGEEITMSMVNQTLHLQDQAVCSEYRISDGAGACKQA